MIRVVTRMFSEKNTIAKHDKDQLLFSGNTDVYLSKDKKRILKIFNRQNYNNLARHQNEVFIHQTIYHIAPDHVPRILDFGYSPRFILMENCGTDGVEMYNEERMTTAIATSFVTQLAPVLHAMHERNIKHGDIKPDNTVYKDGIWSFIDFEFSAMLNTVPIGRTLTYQYASPCIAHPYMADRLNAPHRLEVMYEHYNFALSALTCFITVMNYNQQGNRVEFDIEMLTNIYKDGEIADKGLITKGLEDDVDEWMPLVVKLAKLVLWHIDTRAKYLVWFIGTNPRCTFVDIDESRPHVEIDKCPMACWDDIITYSYVETKTHSSELE